ncbi:hypothetical protein [Rhodococcus sp. P1Y]|uniref:hypothetical protein n=1 Tax=Rhodococcus sp. P1Y TaxID=1302308 RepID=UPI00129359FB|nr:hypothetical protein [Rhodococcus sp. P1Y]
MTKSASPATQRPLILTVVLLPLLWWCLTLVVGALGLMWDDIGDLVVTWNIVTAVGLILLIPAALFAFNGVSELPHRSTFRRGRWYATAALSLTALFCVLAASTPVLNAIAPPTQRDPNSWSPVLTTGEEWVAAAPYAIFLLPVVFVLSKLWRVVPAVLPDEDR